MVDETRRLNRSAMPGAPVEAPATNHRRSSAEAQTFKSLSYCNLRKPRGWVATLLEKIPTTKPPKHHVAARRVVSPISQRIKHDSLSIRQVYSAVQCRLNQIQKADIIFNLSRVNKFWTVANPYEEESDRPAKRLVLDKSSRECLIGCQFTMSWWPIPA